MSHIRPFLKFQTESLGYRFRDIGLLTEALTHSLNPDHDATLLPNHNNLTFDLLHTVGCSVLKLVTAQHALQTSEIDAGEGELSRKRDKLLNIVRVQTEIGKRLFLDDHGNVISCIRTKSCSTPLQLDWFVKSVLGAVFIDAGGFAGGGITAVETVFLRLWKPFLDPGLPKPLSSCFTVPVQISGFWVEKSVHVFASVFCNDYLGYSFNNSDLLCEAIIHKSFYDPIRTLAGSLHQPHYQRLEYLGDSVLELVIAEYLCVAGYPTLQGIKQAIQKLTSRASQMTVAAKIRVQDFVQVNNATAQLSTKYDDIVESVIGAMYVDGVVAGKNYGKLVGFIKQKWGLCAPSPIQPTYHHLESKLGYKFQNEKLLATALTHPGATATSPQQCMSYKHLSLFGKEVIKMLAAEYVVCTSKPNAKYGVMESTVMRLISANSTLKEIAIFLQLQKLVRLPNNLVGDHNSGAFRRWENFVCSLMAAIYVDIGSGGSSPLLIQVFYRVWNVYLMQCPVAQSLGDCFIVPSSSESQRAMMREKLGRVLSDALIYEIEENIGHTFKNKNLLEQALTDRACRGWSSCTNDIGDSTRFRFIADYIVLPFVACFVGLLSTEHRVPDTDVLCFMNRNLWNEIRYFDSALMGASYAVPFGITKGVDYPSLVAAIVGAVFVDDKRALQSDNLLKFTGYVSKLPVEGCSNTMHGFETTTKTDILNSTNSCVGIGGGAVVKGDLIRRKKRKRRTRYSSSEQLTSATGSREQAYKLQNYNNSPILGLKQQQRSFEAYDSWRDYQTQQRLSTEFRYDAEDPWRDRDHFDELYYKYYAEADQVQRFYERRGNRAHQSQKTGSSCCWNMIKLVVLIVAFKLFCTFMFGCIYK